MSRSQGENANNSQLKQIKEAKYQIQELDYTFEKNNITGAISNNLKYIILGGEDRLLTIWKYKTINLFKQIKFNDFDISSCKFTDESKLLYVGTYQTLYQFYANNFKKLYQQKIHDHYITNIVCISNTIILTSSYDETIIKTNVNLKQQLFKIFVNYHYLKALDYNKNLKVIASASNNQSIKLWDGNDGDLIIQQYNAHNNYRFILQILFIINNNQLISLDDYDQLIIWSINYEKKQLHQLEIIKDFGANISLILNQQFIITTVEGKFIKQINHKKGPIYLQHYEINIIQPDSFQAVLILGQSEQHIVKIVLD